MTKTLPLSRPATSAIAAFLALSTPAAFAQTAPADAAPTTPTEASPAVQMSPPVMIPPVAPTVDAPATTPAPQTVQPTAPVIRVPLNPEPETPPAQAAETPEAPVKKAAQTEPSAPEQRGNPAPSVAKSTVATRSAAEEPLSAGEPAAALETADAVPPPAVVSPQADRTSAPIERADAADSAFPWELAGGAAVLLIAGGAAFAFSRRRRSVVDNAPIVMAEERLLAPAPIAPAAAIREERPVPAPTQPRSTPAFAAAPHGSMGRHEAMAMAGPTDDNPFLTLKKRLKRARFYDRRERMEYDALLGGQKDMRRTPASAWDIAQRPAPAPAEQEVLRPEPARGHRGLRPGFAKG